MGGERGEERTKGKKQTENFFFFFTKTNKKPTELQSNARNFNLIFISLKEFFLFVGSGGEGRQEGGRKRR